MQPASSRMRGGVEASGRSVAAGAPGAVKNQAVIVNLAVENRDARRFLGSLLIVGIEQAAKARGSFPPDRRYGSMHLEPIPIDVTS
jgi:hypothetical protein